MKTYKLILSLCLVYLLTACSFNNKFHHSDKIPINIEAITSYDLNKDTTYFDYNKETTQIMLSKSNNEIINKHFTIENRFFLSTNGNKLNGWILKPKNQKPIATILHFHGSAANILFQYESIVPLVEKGFQVFTFDYSGYGFSEGKSNRKNVLEDAFSALDFVKNEDSFKNTKHIIYGESYGGYLAAIVSAEKQKDIDGIVIEGAFSAHKEEAKYEIPFWGNLVKNEAIAAVEIQKNYKPLLIIHSVEDKKVPIKFGREIFDNANMPKEFYEINKPHTMGLQYYGQEIATKIKKMCALEE